ncbi:MAG: AMP-binding protein, partial [Meiothermus silvanus]|nr:AMP-binding protein [Allomeiothermus silvanus]
LTFHEVTARGSSTQAVDQVAVSPDDLATLLFTSGTTGTPKAVMLSHRNMLSNVWAVKEVIHVNEQDRLLLVLPMHHPFPLTLGLVMPLAIGAMVAYENDLRRVRERSSPFLKIEVEVESVEAAAEASEELLEKYLGGEEVDEQGLSKAFHEAVRKGLVYPVAIGSSGAMIGLDLLLQLFLEALPSPSERFGEGPCLGKVFKVQVDPFIGHVAFVRIYRGTLKPGDTLQSEGGAVKLGHLYTAKGKDLVELPEAPAGTILAIPKAESLHRGMILWTGNRPESDEVPFARLPDPNVMMALYLENRGDEAKLGEALRKLLEEDPSLKVERNPETGEMLLWGHGDLHLETAKERLADYGVK